MKFIHTADLHIGKTVNEFSLIEDQQYFLQQIIALAKKEQVDGLIIAGDVYDRAIPSSDAVTVFDAFLSELSAMKIPVLMISGNHDSPERLGFAGKILEKEGVYIASDPLETPKCVILKKDSEYFRSADKQAVEKEKYISMTERICILLVPYVKPAILGVKTNQEAVEQMLEKACDRYPELQEKDTVKILVTHYFVTNAGIQPELSDSETTVNVGGLDNVDASVFKAFDYVALGHIHKPQKVGEGQVYYAGTPMKYSFSEVNQEKGVNLIDTHMTEHMIADDKSAQQMEQKTHSGQIIGITPRIQIQRFPIAPLHDMRKIKGKLEELIKPEVVASANCQDYIQATLTNEEELIDPIGTLRSVYPNTMQMILAKNEIAGGAVDVTRIQKSKSILELYEDFYQIVREEELPEDRREIVLQTIKEIEE